MVEKKERNLPRENWGGRGPQQARNLPPLRSNDQQMPPPPFSPAQKFVVHESPRAGAGKRGKYSSNHVPDNTEAASSQPAQAQQALLKALTEKTQKAKSPFPKKYFPKKQKESREQASASSPNVPGESKTGHIKTRYFRRSETH